MSPLALISLIIPTYNRARLVCETIDSVLGQTRVPDEIIVVDDGSTDDTLIQLARYGDKIRVISQANAGRSAARNRGMDAATGDLIALLDSDDTLHPASVEKRAAYLETHPGDAVVYSNVLVMSADGTPHGPFRRQAMPSGDVFAALAVNNFFPPHAFMFRVECLRDTGPFDSSLEPLEDYDFWLRMAQHHRFAYLPEALAYYRIHDAMTMAGDLSAIGRKGADVHARIFHMPAFQRLTRRQKARVFLSQGTKRSRSGQAVAARYYYWKAIRSAPAYWRGYVLMAAQLLLGQARFRLGRYGLPGAS